MSCYVDLYCQQCDASCGLELNREHAGLAALIAARQDVQAIRSGLNAFREVSHDERFQMLLIRVVNFFWEHDNHAIVVRDEYGQMSGPKETP